MAKRNEYTFVMLNRPSADLAERWARFLADMAGKSINTKFDGTFRTLPPEEIGKRPLVNPAALLGQREAAS